MARIKCSKCGQRDYETVVLGAEREARKFMAEYR
jgi:predicted nucleic-acid-binding Zn-ribbon protein